MKKCAFGWQLLWASMILAGIGLAALATYAICSQATFPKWNVVLLYICSFLLISCGMNSVGR